MVQTIVGVEIPVSIVTRDMKSVEVSNFDIALILNEIELALVRRAKDFNSQKRFTDRNHAPFKKLLRPLIFCN